MCPSKTSPGAVLITGGAKRIGRSLALSLAAEGYPIALHYHRSKQSARQTAAEIREAGGICEIFSCDLSDERQTKKLITTVRKHFPHLNVLINNASIFERSGFKVAGTKILDRHFAVHLKAPYILISEFARLCRKGSIINILDTHITTNRTSHTAYLLSKKSLADLTLMAAAEFAPHIRINGVAPGLILAPEQKSDEYLERLAKNVPLKKRGNPLQIVETVKFFLNNEYLTGQIIHVDGGEHLNER